MNALRDVRWAAGLGLAYLLITLFAVAATAVRKTEENLQYGKNILRECSP